MSDQWLVTAYQRDQNDTAKSIIRQLLAKAGLPDGRPFAFTDEGRAAAESLRAQMNRILNAYGYPRARMLHEQK